MLGSIIIVIITGFVILLYYLLDKNRDMERHFHQHDKPKYYLLLIASAVIFLSFSFNLKHIVVNILKRIYKEGKHLLRPR